MSSMMTDLLEGSLQPEVANAVTNAGGKMLKVVELQQKYGAKGANGRVLSLVGAEEPQSQQCAVRDCETEREEQLLAELAQLRDARRRAS
jgi:hypothetical protein